MNKFLRIMFLCLLLCVNAVFGQARSSIGFSLGANHTFNKYDHELHPSLSLLGNVRITNKLSIEPGLGLHEVSNYGTARLSAKYYVSNRVFVSAGPIFWVGSDLYTGFATTTSAGYRLFNRPGYNFELSVHGNFGKYIYNSTPVAGIRAAYNFHFRKI